MKMTLCIALLALTGAGTPPFWGFFAHEKINRLAVFTLPPEMIAFYKKNVDYLARSAVLPDKRRYAMEEEAPRHYLDVDHYSDHALPRHWPEAIALLGEDTLRAHGVLPWHIFLMYFRLRDAFLTRDPDAILKLSAELGHYVADAHVPLHTTMNYNGQLTGQEGIHGFWESRLPELFSDEYNYFVGKAEYLGDPQQTAWSIVTESHELVADVLHGEKTLSGRFEEKKYAFETRGRSTVKVYSPEYARAYHKVLDGMVERQMRAAIRMTGSFWYTAWVDAGQPDLKKLINHTPSERELEENREALQRWKDERRLMRDHE